MLLKIGATIIGSAVLGAAIGVTLGLADEAEVEKQQKAAKEKEKKTK